jgi:hypothetical protein
MDGLEDQESGRPKRFGEDPPEADLAERLETLERENKMLKQRMELKDLLAKIGPGSASGRAKKK